MSILRLPLVTQLLREGTIQNKYAGIPCDILEKRALAFHYSCTHETIKRVLISLGQERLTRMMTEQDTTHVGVSSSSGVIPSAGKSGRA